MMQSEGSILAQIQDIVKEELQVSFNQYLQVENGTYFGKSFNAHYGSIKEKHAEINMHSTVAICIKCGRLMKAIRRYKTCPRCDGFGSYMGYGKYEWCTDCNCYQEVEV